MRKFFTLLSFGIIAFIAYTYGAKAGRGRYREIRATIDAVQVDRILRLEEIAPFLIEVCQTTLSHS